MWLCDWICDYVGCGQICGYVEMQSGDLSLCWEVVVSVAMLDVVRSMVILRCGQICGYVGTRSGNPCSNYVLLSLSVICNLLQSVDFMTMLRPCSSERS